MDGRTDGQAVTDWLWGLLVCLFFFSFLLHFFFLCFPLFAFLCSFPFPHHSHLLAAWHLSCHGSGARYQTDFGRGHHDTCSILVSSPWSTTRWTLIYAQSLRAQQSNQPCPSKKSYLLPTLPLMRPTPRPNKQTTITSSRHGTLSSAIKQTLALTTTTRSTTATTITPTTTYSS